MSQIKLTTIHIDHNAFILIDDKSAKKQNISESNKMIKVINGAENLKNTQ